MQFYQHTSKLKITLDEQYLFPQFIQLALTYNPKNKGDYSHMFIMTK